MPNAKIGFSKAMSLGWIALDKTAAGGPTVVRKVASIVDVTRDKLGHLDALGASEKQEFKKRKLVQEMSVSFFIHRIDLFPFLGHKRVSSTVTNIKGWLEMDGNQ